MCEKEFSDSNLFVLYLVKRCTYNTKKVQITVQLKDNNTKRNRFTQINNQIVKPGWPIKLAKLCQLISNWVPKLIYDVIGKISILQEIALNFTYSHQA